MAYHLNRHDFLSNLIADKEDRRLALIVVALSALGFVAAIPFASVKLLQLNAFIPPYEAALLLIDAVTALMLFGQFRWSRSPALLVLAAGYLYDALIIIPHALSFPGAFAPAGLLGGGQTTAWLFNFWHGGFPLFVIGYVALNAREARNTQSRNDKSDVAKIAMAIVVTIAVAIGLTVLATHHGTLLPTLMDGNAYRPALTIAVSCTWALGLIAIGLLWRQRQHTVLDLWLMVMLCAWVFDIALSAVFNTARFDLGFYVGRGYGLLAASFVLGMLLTETGGLYSRLVEAKTLVDDYAHRLEGRVLERTAELAQSNQTLSAETAERRKTEEQLHRAQKMEALGQLTGGLAHDFNNHLAIIIGNLDVLHGLRHGNAEENELLQDALEAALRGSELTRSLLAFARRQPLRPERIDVNDLVGGITKLLSRTLGENIEIKLGLDAAIPVIIADAAQLETAIANLANNARDAMPSGGQLTITTSNRRLDEDYAAAHAEVDPGDYVMIEVGDTGLGMPSEVLERIFEPFYTTKGPGKGTGLGLSMVFGFMKQSRGHINVYSELGQGTIFRLYLRPAEIPAASADKVIPLEQVCGSGETILVVEDNAKLRRVVVKQLTDLGYTVLQAENGRMALEILDSGKIVDLLFSDIVMPGEIDGCALARAFVAQCPNARVLLTSGFPGTRLVGAEGLKASICLLSKPYRKDELARAVREAIDDAAPPTRLDFALSGA